MFRGSTGRSCRVVNTNPSRSCHATPASDRSLVSFLDAAAGLLDQLGAAGVILQPQLFALWKDEIANRRAMFTLLDPLAEASPTPATAPPDLAAVGQWLAAIVVAA
jgi:hypothetical protein